MIGYLSGKVLEILGDQILLRLPNGIGYFVTINSTTRFIKNEHIDLYILEVIRDTNSELFGFRSIEERSWVKRLQKVSGVGPKMACQIVYTLGADPLASIIQGSDATTLSTVKGLGSKTAKKIILELQGEMVDIDQVSNNVTKGPLVQEFTEALTSLGYRRSEIVSAVTHLKNVKEWDTGDLSHTIRAGLRYLSK
jgi:holliday junction DNA helicase RuvA